MNDALFITEAEAMFTRLYQISYSILRSRADAEDAVQQALLKAWQARGRIHDDAFAPYVARIVINESRNVQRFRMRVILKADVEPETVIAPLLGGILDAVEGLAPKYRAAFTLKYIAGLSEREAAAALKLPVSTIKNRLARAREMLRSALEDQEVIIE